jgi:hypothetical protein
MSGCDCVITAGITTPYNRGITFRNVISVGVAFPAPAGTTLVHYDPTELNGESGQIPATYHASPSVIAPNFNFSHSGYYTVGGPVNVFGILASDGTITGVGPGSLIPDVAPGPGHEGPGGTSKLPFSDMFGYDITTRIAAFANCAASGRSRCHSQGEDLNNAVRTRQRPRGKTSRRP